MQGFASRIKENLLRQMVYDEYVCSKKLIPMNPIDKLDRAHRKEVDAPCLIYLSSQSPGM